MFKDPASIHVEPRARYLLHNFLSVASSSEDQILAQSPSMKMLELGFPRFMRTCYDPLSISLVVLYPSALVGMVRFCGCLVNVFSVEIMSAASGMTSSKGCDMAGHRVRTVVDQHRCVQPK